MSRNSQRNSPQVTITHGDDQLEYLKFKRTAFGDLAGKLTSGKSGYCDKPVWNMHLNVVDETYEIAKEMVISGRHPSGRRRWAPTNRFLEWVDEQALAVWYLDNGCLRTVRLASRWVKLADETAITIERDDHDLVVGLGAEIESGVVVLFGDHPHDR